MPLCLSTFLCFGDSGGKVSLYKILMYIYVCVCVSMYVCMHVYVYKCVVCSGEPEHAW